MITNITHSIYKKPDDLPASVEDSVISVIADVRDMVGCGATDLGFPIKYYNLHR